MSSTVPELAAVLQSLFTTEADRLAHQHGLVRRQRLLSGSSLALTLVFGWLEEPDASLDDLTDVAAHLGSVVTPQALDQRFTPAAVRWLQDLLQQALHHVFQSAAPALPLLRRFQGVYIYDTTTLSLPDSLAQEFPGCGGLPGQGLAACKIQVCLELTQHGLLELTLTDGRTNDLENPLAHQPLPEGSLRLADLGFFDLNLLEHYNQTQVFWISRLHAGTNLFDAEGHKWKLEKFLAQQQQDTVDVPIRLGDKRVSARLVAVRLPAPIVAKRRQQLHKKARKSGRGYSVKQWELCAWDVTITNVPGAMLSREEVIRLRRVRWQVELLFKVWKSEGGVDRLHGKKPCRVLCELSAKLLGQVVRHWVQLVSGGCALEISQRRGARRVRRSTLRLMGALAAALDEVVEVLESLAKRLQRCRMVKRRSQPSTFQLFLGPVKQ